MPASRSGRPDLVRNDPWWRFGLVTVGMVLRITHRLRFEGLENIPPEGPAILAANHVSPLDPIAMCLGAAERGRTVRFLTAAEAFEIPVIGWGLRRFRQIPIRRGAADLGAMEDALDVIRAGALAGIFPEGGLGDGPALRPPKRGMARLALGAGVPVVPVGVWGFQVRWPRGGIRWRPPARPVGATVFGPPIRPQGDPASDEHRERFSSEVMLAIEQLLRRAQDLAG